MKIKNILMSAAMIGALSSCNLDEVYYSQTTPDNFLENEVTINQLLTRPMQHWAYVINEYMVEVNEESADCFVWPARTTGDGHDGSNRPNMRNHAMTEQDHWADTGWKEALQGVARCLDVIDKLNALNYPAMGIDPAKKDTHIGQMKALMGFFYMVGLDWYGGLPIYESTSDPLLPRKTAKETFTYTENLFKEAIAGLPARESLNEEVSGFLRKGSAAMLLARLYFNAESYIGVPMFDEAQKICEDIIAGVYGPYELEDNWKDLFGFNNHFSKEILWGTPADWNYRKNDWYHLHDGMFPYKIYKYLGISYSGFNTWCHNGESLTPSRDPEYNKYLDTKPEIKLGSPYEKFDDADQRKKCYRYLGNGDYEGMFLIGKLQDPEFPERATDYERSYGPYKPGVTVVIYDKMAPWAFLKENLTKEQIEEYSKRNIKMYDTKAEMPSEFVNCADEGDGVRLMKRPIPDDRDPKLQGTPCSPNVRLSEVYYTLAECKLRKGDKQGAADLINQVRKRYFDGGMDPNPVTASNLDKYRMLDEWLIEFLGEGRRRTDLIRWGAFHTEPWWDHKPTNNKNVCRMPLGDSVIGSNNLLKQNPGYGGNELSADEI